MGAYILFTLCLFVTTNGFWYCLTMPTSLSKIPVAILTALSLLCVLVMVGGLIYKHWDDKPW